MKKKIVVVNVEDVKPVKKTGQMVRRAITKQRAGSEQLMLGVAYSFPGGVEEWRSDRDEVYYILKGKMKISYDGEEVEVKAGDAVFLPKGLKYQERYDQKEECVYVYALTPPLE